MAQYEYKVIPAPNKGRKAPGVKKPEARFAYCLQEVMNEAAADGWEYQRADILPSEERQGLTSSHTVYRSVLVFRRPVAGAPATTDIATDESAAADTATVAAVIAATAASEPPLTRPTPDPDPEPYDVPTADAHDDAHVEFTEHADHDTAAHTANEDDHDAYTDTDTDTASDHGDTANEDEDDTLHRG